MTHSAAARLTRAASRPTDMSMQRVVGMTSEPAREQREMVRARASDMLALHCWQTLMPSTLTPSECGGGQPALAPPVPRVRYLICMYDAGVGTAHPGHWSTDLIIWWAVNVICILTACMRAQVCSMQARRIRVILIPWYIIFDIDHREEG